MRGRPVFRRAGLSSHHHKTDTYCTLAGYDWQAFTELLRQLFAVLPCLLCGHVHALKIRSVLLRCIRSPQEGENTRIKIIVIICPTAKSLGTQYTKRLLPPFVIPYCVICREAVMTYLRLCPRGTMHSAIASLMMGTVDIRTMRRHLRWTMQLIEDAALTLWDFLDEVPVGPSFPDPRGSLPLEFLDAAAQEIDREAHRVRGAIAPVIPAVAYVHALDVYARAYRPLAPVSTLVLRYVLFHDTS